MRRWTYDLVKEVIEKEGYTLLSSVYTNCAKKLEMSCPNGHACSITFNEFSNNRTRCSKCSHISGAIKRKISFKKVLEIVISKGYRPLFTEYRNNHTKLLMECPQHGPFQLTLSDLQGGHGCRACGYEKSGDRKRTPIEVIRKKVEDLGLELISESYKRFNQKITVRCPIHGDLYEKKCEQLMNQSRGCKKCGTERAHDVAKKTTEEFKKEIEGKIYKLVSECDGLKNKAIFLCPVHGEFEALPGNIKRGSGCLYCSCIISKAEAELFNTIKSVFPSIRKLRVRKKDMILDKPWIKGFDIDCYVSELKKGIEFDGMYWHSFEAMKTKKRKKGWPDDDILHYHEIKDAYFATLGIEILHIKEADWIKDKEACVRKCLEFLSNPISISPTP